MRITSVALAVMTIAIMITASALNAIANSKNETAPRWNGSGAGFQYGIVHVSMPKGGKTIPPELLPEP